MKKNVKGILTLFVMVLMLSTVSIPVFAAENSGIEAEIVETTQNADENEDNAIGDKAIAAAIAVGLAAAAGAIGMGLAIAKSSEAISRQPEAEDKIRTTLMLGLVFVETAIIYALVIAILIIFVL